MYVKEFQSAVYKVYIMCEIIKYHCPLYQNDFMMILQQVLSNNKSLIANSYINAALLQISAEE